VIRRLSGLPPADLLPAHSTSTFYIPTHYPPRLCLWFLLCRPLLLPRLRAKTVKNIAPPPRPINAVRAYHHAHERGTAARAGRRRLCRYLSAGFMALAACASLHLRRIHLSLHSAMALPHCNTCRRACLRTRKTTLALKATHMAVVCHRCSHVSAA